MSDHLVITVHGIRTYGQWQERLEALLPEEQRDKIEFVHYKLGYFSIIKFLFPPARWLVTRQFRKFLAKEISNSRWQRIDLVGHSFGTHVIAWALRSISHTKSNKIHTIVLSGSVLRSDFSWSQVLGRAAKRVINDCSVRDHVLILSQLFSLFTGDAGRQGFIGATGGATGAELRNRFFRFGHSGYFATPQGTNETEFMKKYWLPLILESQDIDVVDCRDTNPLSELLTWFLNNANIIKLTVYFVPIILFVLWINGLYTQGKIDRISALQNESRTLALVSQEMSQRSRFRDGIQLALNALPTNVSDPDRPYVPQAETSLYHAILSYRYNSMQSFPTGVLVLDAFVDSTTNRVVTLSSTSSDIVPTNRRLLQVRDIEAKQILYEQEVSGYPSKFASSDHGNLFAFVNRNGTRSELVVHNMRSDTTIHYPLDKQYLRIDDIAFSSDGGHVMAISLPSDRSEAVVLQSWPVKPGGIALAPSNVPLQGAFMSFGAWFTFGASAQYVWSSDAEQIRIWHASSGNRAATVSRTQAKEGASCTNIAAHAGQLGNVEILAFSKDARYLIFKTKPHVAAVWDIQGNTQLAVLPGHSDVLRDAAFSSDNGFIITASADGTARIWDISSSYNTDDRIPTSEDGACSPEGRLDKVLEGHGDEVIRVAFTSKDRVVTISLDGSLREWNIETGLQLGTLRVFTGSILSDQISFSPDSNRVLIISPIYTGIRGHRVRLWKLDSGEGIASFLASGPRKNRVVISPNGRRALSILATRTHTPLVWNVDTASELSWLSGHENEVHAATFNSDGSYIATASADGSVGVWDVESGKMVRELYGHVDQVFFVAFSPGDGFIITASKDETIRIWDPWNSSLIGKIPFKYQTSPNQDASELLMDMLLLFPIKVSSEAQYVAFPMIDSDHVTLVVWNVQENKQHRIFRVRNSISQVWLPRFDMCYLENRILIISPEDGKTARVIDLDGQEQDVVLGEHNHLISSVAFNKKCDRVVTASLDRTARVWDYRNGELVSNLIGHGASVLSAEFSTNGQRVVTASEDRTVRIWDVVSGNQVGVIDLVHTGRKRQWVALSARFSADGERVVAVSADAKGFLNKVVRVFPFYQSQALINHARAVLVGMEGRSPN